MKLTTAQRAMYDALMYLAGEPDMFRPGINCHGAGQCATARALARRGMATYYPAIRRVEPGRDMCAIASLG